MTNKRKGEVSLEINGKKYNLLVTLGALAEVEEALGISSLQEFDDVMTRASFKVASVLVLAFIRGGGADVPDDFMLTAKMDLADAKNAVNEAFDRSGLFDKQKGGGEPEGEPKT